MKHILVILVITVLGLCLAPVAAQDDEQSYHYTYHRADGNRVANGHGTFPDVQVFYVRDEDSMIIPGDRALWLTGEIIDGMPFWNLVTEQGYGGNLYFRSDGILIA